MRDASQEQIIVALVQGDRVRLMQAEELAAAKGIELPADFLAEASAGGLRRSALEGFAALQVGALLECQSCHYCSAIVVNLLMSSSCLDGVCIMTVILAGVPETGACCVAITPGACLPRPPHRGPPLLVQGTPPHSLATCNNILAGSSGTLKHCKRLLGY